MTKGIKIFQIIGLWVVGLWVAPVVNGSELYLGLSYAQMDFSSDNSDEEATLDYVYGRFGAHFTRNVSGELRLGAGLDEDELSTGAVKNKILYGAYIRDGIHIGDVFFPFLMIGYSGGEFEFSHAEGANKTTKSGFSYGLGADFNLLSWLTINTEYLVYMNKTDADLKGFSLGLEFKL